VPDQCLGATNLTEWWREYTNDRTLKPGGALSWYGYACDIRPDLQWFRITGNAGQRILNFCPKMFSCGTKWPIWSDGKLPERVGEVSEVNAYEAGYFTCTDNIRRLRVVRCSEEADFDVVYQFVESPKRKSCASAVCTTS